MNVTTLAKIKERLGLGDADTEHNTLLTTILTNVSGRIERFLNRTLETGSVTRIFDVADGQRVFSLKAYPVSAITSVKNDTEWDWSGTSAMDSSYYQENAASGVLYFWANVLVPGYQALQVIYSGGMAADADALIAAYPDLSEAGINQVVYEFNHRDSIGIPTLVAAGGASLSFVQDSDLLPSVRGALKSLRRHCG